MSLPQLQNWRIFRIFEMIVFLSRLTQLLILLCIASFEIMLGLPSFTPVLIPMRIIFPENFIKIRAQVQMFTVQPSIPRAQTKAP